jgi:Copper binding periplasmic protein CusF
MGTARIFFASAAAVAMLASTAYAEDMTGMITQINRLNSTIAIQPTQKPTVGTVGTSAGNAVGPVQEFKAKDAGMLESVHAGDRVTFATTDANGTKTLTKLQKQ